MSSTTVGVLFDLDGVLTDTAEYHYLAWKQLADELGIAFTRTDNDQLRGVSRRASLQIILDIGGRTVSEPEAEAMMEHKNSLYRQMLRQVSEQDLLPGVGSLLDDLRKSGVKIAVASASRNSPDVVRRLGIEDRIDALAHGGMVERQKPAPDLFLHAAELLGAAPAACVVVEDAAAGVEAALAAGMKCVGLGPEARVGQAHLVLPDLRGTRAATLISLVSGS
jgi:beta-phosphoglucomutase